MKKTFCDNCKNKLPEDFVGEAYSYDWCGKEKCAQKLEKRFDEH